jgi:hypothetical protein
MATRLEKKTFYAYACKIKFAAFSIIMKGVEVIRKIISGGQCPVELAALDLAIKLEIPYKGWMARGDGDDLREKYHLALEKSGGATVCMEKNLQESQGVLVVCQNTPPETFHLLKKLANQHGKDFLRVDLEKISKFECALNISRWISENRIEVLYVTGEKSQKEKSMYEAAVDILETVLYLDQVETGKPLAEKPSKLFQPAPKTVEEAVECLEADLSLKDRVTIAQMTFGELGGLNLTLGKYIRDSFGLWSGNPSLVDSCRARKGSKSLQNEEVPVIIIQALWETLKSTHRLRVVK